MCAKGEKTGVRKLVFSPQLINLFQVELFMLWRLIFARVKINRRSVYSCILTRVCAVAMATGLIKYKA